MINDQGKSRQIDHIAITEYGVFVIETKNYAGIIYGKENSTEWKQYLNHKCFTFKNPIHQNYGHKQIVQKVIQKDEIPVNSIIVFINRCKLKTETTSPVLYDNQILSYIASKQKTLTEQSINEIYQLIMENRITNQETIQNHNYNVQRYIEYKNNIANVGECPRCKGKLILRNGRNGKFYGCSNYPKCRYTKNI